MRLEAGTALRVLLRGEAGAVRDVGRLAWRDRRAWFQYDDAFLGTGPSLSPFRLPFASGLHEAPREPFDGLFGVFDDSLPDGWGRLLQDRRATDLGIAPAALSPLDRLAQVGGNGLGVLAYEPDLGGTIDAAPVDLDHLDAEATRVLEGAGDDVLLELLRIGGSPQGSRPKALVWLRPSDFHVTCGAKSPSRDHQRVLAKLRAKGDASDAGATEKAYQELARRAGIEVPDAWLVPSRTSSGWFAAARFDRTASGGFRHVHTLCGLLHADHRLPSLDYVGAHAAVHRLTGDFRAVEQLFRRMVFNVVAHNRDDHTKQITLALDDDRWTLAPAYDLTCADGPGGEHSMAVAGRGDPDRKAVLEVAARVGIASGRARDLVEEVSAAVIDGWPEVAPSAAARRRIGKKLRALR